MAAVAGVALQTSVQTHEFVANGKINHICYGLPNVKINEEIESKIGDLQQAVSWVGDQKISIQHQLMLSCDWNVTMHCVSPAKYNVS
jgi:hypothetical protein